MKRKILIIEDQFEKYFVTKQIISGLLRIPVEERTVSSTGSLTALLHELRGQVLFCVPDGSALDIYQNLSHMGANRRNSEVVMIGSPEISPEQRALLIALFYEIKAGGGARTARAA